MPGTAIEIAAIGVENCRYLAFWIRVTLAGDVIRLDR